MKKYESTRKPGDHKNHEILESGSFNNLNSQPIYFWMMRSWKKISILKTCHRKKVAIKRMETKFDRKKPMKDEIVKNKNLKNNWGNSIEREREKKTWKLVSNKLNVERWNGDNSI